MHIKIAIIGLGYVGLPLAVEFGKKFPTKGFDINKKRIQDLSNGQDATLEISSAQLNESVHLSFSTEIESIRDSNFFIITVPTPVDKYNHPDLTSLREASKVVSTVLKRGDIVIYESTVYPGATEEECVPILEKYSGLHWKKDFNVGYSPERINPGDKEHTVTKIIKVVSGDEERSLDRISDIYSQVIEAGVYRAPSIIVAEAAKVIENTQRDINIALMNELAIIFDRMNVNTADVLAAANTKWNFLPFYPGLVGGHCIGVDPYYLTYKSEMLGYKPELILAGRRINDGVPNFVANQTVKRMIKLGDQINKANIIVLGVTFKEDCPDVRNSKTINLIQEFKEYGCNVFVCDPQADPKTVYQEYGLELSDWNELPEADAMVVAVPHEQFLSSPLKDTYSKLKKGGLFVDIKSAFNRNEIRSAGFEVWQL